MKLKAVDDFRYLGSALSDDIFPYKAIKMQGEHLKHLEQILVRSSVRIVNHILLECPIVTRELFQKNGYDFIAWNNIRDVLYNSDVILNFCY